MRAREADGDAFWAAGPGLDGVVVRRSGEVDPDEAPALRGITRPQQWHAPAPPSSVLAALYTSVQRRAREVLAAGSYEAPGTDAGSER